MCSFIGCEYFGYNSDITRTWPLNGRFTGPQVALYEAVLDVQTELIKLLGQRPTLNQLFSEMCRLLGNNLKDLCILPQTATPNELAAVRSINCLKIWMESNEIDGFREPTPFAPTTWVTSWAWTSMIRRPFPTTCLSSQEWLSQSNQVKTSENYWKFVVIFCAL